MTLSKFVFIFPVSTLGKPFQVSHSSMPLYRPLTKGLRVSTTLCVLLESSLSSKRKKESIFLYLGVADVLVQCVWLMGAWRSMSRCQLEIQLLLHLGERQVLKTAFSKTINLERKSLLDVIRFLKYYLSFSSWNGIFSLPCLLLKRKRGQPLLREGDHLWVTEGVPF